MRAPQRARARLAPTIGACSRVTRAPARPQDLAEELLEGSLFNLIAEAVLGEFDATKLPRQIVTNLEVTASPSASALEFESAQPSAFEHSAAMGAGEFGEEYDDDEAFLPAERGGGGDDDDASGRDE